MKVEFEKRLKRYRAERDGIRDDKAKLESREQTLDALIAELESLLRVAPNSETGGKVTERHLRTGTDPYKAREVLRQERKELHIKAIVEKIGGDDGRSRITSLAAQLAAYAKKNEIFVKTGPNVFGLIDYGPEPVGMATRNFFATLEDLKQMEHDELMRQKAEEFEKAQPADEIPW